MKLLLDEMYAPAIADQSRVRGRDVASVHDSDYRELEGEPDQKVWLAAVTDGRALVTENVPDFRRIEAAALASGEPTAQLIFTTDRPFPRGDPPTIGRLVLALDFLLTTSAQPATTFFLRSAPAGD